MTSEAIILGTRNLAVSFAAAFFLMILMNYVRNMKWKKEGADTTGTVGDFIKSEPNLKATLIEPVRRGDIHHYDFSIDYKGKTVNAVYSLKVKNDAPIKDMKGTVLPIYYDGVKNQFLVKSFEKRNMIVYSSLLAVSLIVTLVLQFGYIK